MYSCGVVNVTCIVVWMSLVHVELCGHDCHYLLDVDCDDMNEDCYLLETLFSQFHLKYNF